MVKKSISRAKAVKLTVLGKRQRKQTRNTNCHVSLTSLRRIRAARVLKPYNSSTLKVKTTSVPACVNYGEPPKPKEEEHECCAVHNRRDCRQCYMTLKSSTYLLSGSASSNALLAHCLPRSLARPVFPEASSVDLARASGNSDLNTWTPTEIRRELLLDSRHLHYVFMKTRIAAIAASRTSDLPKSIGIYTPDGTSPQHATTHILAVHSSGRPLPLPHSLVASLSDRTVSGNPSNQDGERSTGARKVTLFPIHSLVLSAHCARIPPLPLSSASTPGNNRTVPLVPFGVPVAECFGVLMQYLYTQDAPAMLRNIIPFWQGADVPRPVSVIPRNQNLSGPLQQNQYEFMPADAARISSLSRELSERLTGASLLSLTMRIHGIWQDACSLGIRGDDVWDVLTVAWSAAVDALAIEKH